ncbi:uncharacterized protein LOC116930710 [Daphnia magna]|uniref:uncharacterized protein LOC116930710 n=1 Tax=Daphnia magna TaxID=35525 RepID=UPI001E1BB410|nr:uncharacterized protein LOC116930710 [Daphnia magna]
MVEESEGDPSSSKNVKILFCTAYGKLPLAIHLDGKFKLLRWLLKHQYEASSLFGDTVISADSDVLKHVNKINEKKIQEKKRIVAEILWSGHWKKGAAATLGEEQEQVFSTMSRYGSCTKHMSDAYKILVARLLKARKQAPIHRQELQKLLKRKWISEKDLPFILEELKIKAIESNNKLASSNWALSYERGDLEGTYLHIKRIERRIALIVGSSKERIMMRKGLSVAKTKVKLRIAQINEAIKECHERQKLGVSRENDRNIETLAKITGNDFHDGVFPWQTDGIVSRENFDIIDTWMLMMRYDEEVIKRLEVDECSSSSSSDENDESPDGSSAEEEVRDGASE